MPSLLNVVHMIFLLTGSKAFKGLKYSEMIFDNLISHYPHFNFYSFEILQKHTYVETDTKNALSEE